MDERDKMTKSEWLAWQVATYGDELKSYEDFASVLESILKGAAKRFAPLAIVQTRAKGITSFAEKCLRKRHKYADPVHQLTDLCGGRVIARTRSEVESLCEFVKSHFIIDPENSIDTGQRLDPSEFGYRSIHYVVSLRPGHDYGIPVPAHLSDLKAEIQVRTTVEHAWADFAHDLSYKGAFELPDSWKREVAVVAAELEDVDRAFGRIEEGLQMYAASYGAYMTEEELRGEIENLRLVLSHRPDDAALATRIGKLAITLGEWDTAIGVLGHIVRTNGAERTPQPILRDLGVAMCKAHRSDPTGDGYRTGQEYLERAAAPQHRDADALASLAGTWRGIDDERARELYRRAFLVDPTDLYPLGNYVEYELADGNLGVLELLEPVVERAMERGRAQIEVGVNIPWAYYSAGKFQLLLGRPMDSLKSYAKAIQTSNAAFMIEGAIASMDALAPVAEHLTGYAWAQRLLSVGLASKFPEASPPLAATGGITPPVVIVVGGTHPDAEKKVQSYRDLLIEAFSGFAGTVICGGTEQGIAGIVGEIGTVLGDGIHTVGYLPSEPLPEDATVDTRYSEVRRTDGVGFTPAEPIQNWIDIVASDISPAEVKVVGINGGEIAGIEYRLALSLGATVGIVRGSGRAAGRVVADEHWNQSENLLALPSDPQTLRSFLEVNASPLASTVVDEIAKAVHRTYLDEIAPQRDKDLRTWDELPETLRESNRHHATQIIARLEQIGCVVEPAPAEGAHPTTFTDAEVERMAEIEHGRWNAERLMDGWTWGETKDIDTKVSPYLVSWAELPDSIRESDRILVRRMPEILARVGLQIRRVPPEE